MKQWGGKKGVYLYYGPVQTNLPPISNSTLNIHGNFVSISPLPPCYYSVTPMCRPMLWANLQILSVELMWFQHDSRCEEKNSECIRDSRFLR